MFVCFFVCICVFLLVRGGSVWESAWSDYRAQGLCVCVCVCVRACACVTCCVCVRVFEYF